MKLTKMAFEINDLKGILILVLLAIPTIASTNINCSGRAFHCVNSTHFMICVDLGGGLSTTIDDFIIPCPVTTVCHENHVFECDFPEVTTPQLQVIGVYKQSDTSEPTSVSASVTAPTPSSEIFSVFKENITATTLSIPEDVTAVVKLKVLGNVKNPVGVNSDSTTETSFKVTSSFIDSTNEVVNDKQTSNNTITTSATDNNKHPEPVVETSIHKPVNTSLTDKSKSIDTVTSVIGLINLISTDLPSVVNTKPSSAVSTSIDTLYDNIVLPTEQYITKQVTIHGEKVENVTEKISVPTEIIFNEISVTMDEYSTTPVVNTYIESDINNTTEFINKIDSGNQTIAVGNSLGKIKNMSELVPETTTEYLAPINIVHISEPVTVDLSPQTTTDNTFVSLGLVELMSDDPKQDAPSTNGYINTFYGKTATTTDQFTTKLETTFSDKPVTAEVISTIPIINTIFQNVLKNDANNDSLTELNSTAEITSINKVPEMNINYFIPEPITTGSQQKTSEKTFVPITTEANIMFSTETTLNSGVLIKNDSLLEKHTTATQPLEIIITTDLSIEPTDNLYQISRELNQTMITVKNNTTSTITTAERAETVFNASRAHMFNKQVTEPTLLPPTTMNNPAFEITTVETLQNGFTAHTIEVKNELRAANFLNAPYVENVKNDTILFNTTNTMNSTEKVNTVFNASSIDINNGKSTEPSTIKYSTIDISTIKTLQNDFTTDGIEAKNELPAANVSMSVDESNFENVGNNAVLSIQATPAPYNVTSAPVTDTTVKELASQPDTVTNPQTGFTPETLALKDLHQATTQKVRTDPETKILGSLYQPENFNTDQLTKTVVDEDVLAVTTPNAHWKNVENSATTPFSNDVTDNTSLSDSVKYDNQDNTSPTNIVNTQDALPEIIPPLTELTSTTLKTVHTTSINVESTKVFEQVSTNTPELLNIYNVPTSDYKIETSIMYPVDVPHITKIKNDTVILVTTLPPQEATNQKIGTVKQQNNNNTSTTYETVGDLVPSTIATAGYVVFNTTYLNTSSWKDSVNIDTVLSKVDPNADVNKTETVNPMNGNNNTNDSLSMINTNKDESNKIVSVSDIVNSSVNAKPNGTLQATSSNSSLSNDYSKTTESQGSRAYETSIDNVPDYKYLVQADELVIQKNPEAIMSLAQKNVMNSILSTPRTYTLPITEINTGKVQHVGTEAPLLNTAQLMHIINPTKTAGNYVTEKTNYYISSTEAILAKLNKLPKVETESSVSSVSDFTPNTPASPQLLKTAPVYDGVTIRDSAFIMSSTEISPKVVTDNNVRISTESPLLTSQVTDTQTVKYNTVPLPNGTLQATSSNSSLSNDYSKTTESQGSRAYETSIDNVPDYKYLVQAEELVTQKNPEAIMSLAQKNVMNSILSTPRTYTLPITEINTGKVQHVGTEAPLLNTAELMHIINPIKTAGNYVTDKTNYYISSTEAILAKLNKLPKVETESSVSSVSEFTPNTPASPQLLKTAPVYDGVTIRDSAFIMSSTEISPKVVTDNNVRISTESPLLTSQVTDTQTVKYNTVPLLPISELSPVAHMTTEPTNIFNVFAQTTPLDKMNQDVLPGVTIVDLPHYETSTLNNNISQLMASLPIVRITAAQITTELTHTTNEFVQTTPLLAAAGRTNLNQGVLPGIETTELPQNVLSTVINKNIPESVPLLPIVGLTAAQMTTEPTHTTNAFAQTTPLLAAVGKTNQDVPPGIKSTDFLQSKMSTVNNNISQSMESLPIAEVTALHIASEPNHTTIVCSQTTPLLAASDKMNQDVPSGTKTTDLPQYLTRMVTNNSTQWISDITTETITDSLTVPDSMVETIKVLGDKVSGTYLADITLDDVLSNNATVNNANYSLMSVKNIIDHESIIVGTITKYNEQNTPISSAKSVDFNKANIVNHTESNLMRSDVNIDSLEIKESSIKEEDSISAILKPGTDVQNKNLLSDSPITSKIEPKDAIPADKIEYRLTTVTTNFKEAVSGAPTNIMQSKKIINKENKNATIDSIVNSDIEIIDVKKYQFQDDFKNISDSYYINNPVVNMTTSQHNLSLQKSTINDELEQHLLSTNHTITTEVQSHLNESDKQSNKTSDELTLNGTSMHNPNLTSIKLNAGRNDTSAITVSALVFNCSNHTRGKYADKKDCRKFYTCIGTLVQPILGTCPNNTVFSEINKQCTTNLSHCVRNNQFRCLYEGRFSDFLKDNIYYICVKNSMNGFIRYKLQCQDDYHLNKDSIKCEKNEEISIQSASSVSKPNNDESKLKSQKMVSADDFECKNEGKFPYSIDCSKYYVCNEIKNVYYICVKNRTNGFIRYKLQCQDDYHLNTDSVKCEKNEEISTQLAFSVSETNNDESKPKPKSEKKISKDDFECDNEGNFPYPKDCSKYYVCTKIKNVYRRMNMKCASEEVFDKTKKKCVESDSGEC